MKLLFAGNTYYPEGGMLDLKFKGETSECVKWFEDNGTSKQSWGISDDLNWCHIVDAETLEIELYGSLNIAGSIYQSNRQITLTWSTTDDGR